MRGLDRVIETVKQHPIVLVPCHRSHFDYLILSYIFHENCLVAAAHRRRHQHGVLAARAASSAAPAPTSSAARFEGNPLYKTVFRKYLEYLIREGYTQEFFIEGGRSRTGKILTPKLGMLSAIVNVFVDGVRARPLPRAGLDPLRPHRRGGGVQAGAARRPEGAGVVRRACCKARSVLRQKYGTVYVTFAEPISLERGARRAARAVSSRPIADPAIEEEKRHFIQKLGFRILREVNDAAVAGATLGVVDGAARGPGAGDSLWRVRHGGAGAHRAPRPQEGDAHRLAAAQHRELLREPEFPAERQAHRVDEGSRRRHHPCARREADDPRFLQEQQHPFLPDPVAGGARASGAGVPRTEIRGRGVVVARPLPVGVRACRSARRSPRRSTTRSRTSRRAARSTAST